MLESGLGLGLEAESGFEYSKAGGCEVWDVPAGSLYTDIFCVAKAAAGARRIRRRRRISRATTTSAPSTTTTTTTAAIMALLPLEDEDEVESAPTIADFVVVV